MPTLDEFDGDLLILDAGTFLLLFGVLEQSARRLAVARANTQRDKAYFGSRECRLERIIKQLQLSLETEVQISNMAKIRDAAAHGQRIAGTFNLQTLVNHIRRIDVLVFNADS